MRDYGKVYTAFWTSEDVLSMTEDERTLALYLLTCPHGNMLGCFRLTNAYASDDLKWEIERVSKGFGGLTAKGYIYRCDRSFWLVIQRYLKWNQFENPNVGKAAGKLFDSLGAPNIVKAALVAALRDFSPTFPAGILDEFEAENKPFGNPFELSPETGAVTVTGTRTGTGTGTEDTSANIAAAPSIEPARREKLRSSPDDAKCARWLFGRILSNNASAKAPNFDKWANDVRLMREADKKTHAEICELFQWAQQNSFWCSIILSPSKLREKWDQLTMQRNSGRGGHAGHGSQAAPLDLAAAQRAANDEAKRRLGIPVGSSSERTIDASE